MNNTGKAAIAGISLAVILGAGWWVIDRGPVALTDLAGRAKPGGETATGPISNEPKTLSPDWVNEIDASIRLLNETLSMNANIAGSIALLDMIDARIARHEAKTLLAPLRAALASDREKLQAARSLDLAVLAATLDRMVIDLDSIPLLVARQPMLKKNAVASPGGNAGGTAAGTVAGTADSTSAASSSVSNAFPTWQDLWDSLSARLSEVIRIRRVDNPQALLLTPEQSALVAERLRLRLLSARLALVSRQESVFLQDITIAEKLLMQIFDPQDPRVIAHQQTLANFRQLSGRVTIPTGLKASVAMEQLRKQLSPLAPSGS